MAHARIFIVVALMLLLAVPALAQITITSSSFPGPGFAYTSYMKNSGAAFNVGSPGAGQSYTFGVQDWDDEVHTELLNPQNTPYGGSFPTANRAAHNMDGGQSYSYQRVAADGLFLLGNGAPDTVNVLSTPVLEIRLPLTYQTTWSSVLRTTIEPAPGFQVVILDSMRLTCDGWGTLTTPFYSVAALRVFGHDYSRTLMNGEIINESEYLQYSYLSAQGLGVNVMSEDGEVDPNFDAGMISVNLGSVSVDPDRGPVVRDFSVDQNYPNPFNPTTSLPVTMSKPAHVVLEIFDENGRQISRDAIDLSAGSHVLPINGSNWASGSYFARVSAAAEQSTVPMKLIK